MFFYQVGDSCMCGTCVESCAPNSSCGANCQFYNGTNPDNQSFPVVTSLAIQVCGHETVKISFHKCGLNIPLNTVGNGIFDINPSHVDTVMYNCDKKGAKLDPEIVVYIEGHPYDIHTSCSLPLHLGQKFGTDEKMLIVGYCTEFTCNYLDAPICP